MRRSSRRDRTASDRTASGGTASDRPARLRVLRVSHSGVVTAWRERERQLRSLGAELTLATAARWEEGGSMVEFTSDGDGFAVAVRTVGRHPNLFLYDPRPLWRLLGSAHWDLIDMHEEPFGLAVAEVLLLRWLRSPGVPYIFSSAQNIEKRYPPPFRWWEHAALRGAAGAYGCNSEAGRILRRKGLHGEWSYLPLGVDVDRFRAPDRGPPTATLSVGFVGRLIRHKGVDVLLRAVALDDRFTAEIFGSGSESERLIALADSLGIRGRVRFHGHVAEERIPDTYPQVDVVAVPSLPLAGWIEQFGRVVAEAQASGVPVVASDSGALSDVVGGAGLLVPPGDPVALHAALARFLDEPGLWARLRESGMAEVTRHSWKSIADTQMALYQVVTSDGPGPQTGG